MPAEVEQTSLCETDQQSDVRNHTVPGVRVHSYGGTAKKSNAKQFDSYGESYGKGDTIGYPPRHGIPLGMAIPRLTPVSHTTGRVAIKPAMRHGFNTRRSTDSSIGPEIDICSVQ